MMILVSGATTTVRRLAHPNVGAFFVPAARNVPEATLLPGMLWAADNGAFTAFNEEAFLRMLDRLHGTPNCLFVAAPDKVANAVETLHLFRIWEPIIHRYNFPVAFIGQDGLDLAQVPWQSCEAAFLGGTNKFKLGPVGRDFAAYARGLGKWVHMGRVNSLKRMTYADSIGCQSVDGRQWSAFAERYLLWGANHGQQLRETAQGREDGRRLLQGWRRTLKIING